MSSELCAIKIAKVVSETDDTVSIHFDKDQIMGHWGGYKAGQYITIDRDGTRRSYSMSSAPHDAFFRISVKEVPGGKMSPYLCKELKAGDELDLLGPDGRFIHEAKPADKKTYVLLGAGSGITPLMSIMRQILDQEPKSRVVLLYGSRNEKQIIFGEELEQLERDYEGQLFVYHTISKPTRIKKKGFSGMLGAKESLWKGMTGRIDQDKINEVLLDHGDYSKEIEFFLCGPGKMIDNSVLHLKSRGYDTEQIHREYFTADGAAKAGESTEIVESAKLIVTLDKEQIETVFKPGKYLLESLLDAGYEPPYSCTSGACSTCIAKLEDGKVHMDVCLALDEQEIQEGYVLTCQCKALTDTVKVNFDV